MRSVRFALPLLPVVLLASCADSGSVTAPTETLAPQYDAANAPPQSGPHVVRFNDLFGAGFGGDPRDGLAVSAGFEAPIEEVCADFPGQPFVAGSEQLVFPPAGGVHRNASSRSIHIDVFAYGGGVITDPCQLVGAPIVATGTGTFRDMISINPAGQTTRHIEVHGVVDLVSGGQARLHGTARIVIRADGSIQIDEERVSLGPL